MNLRKDGGAYCEEMTITPVRDAAGNIQNFIAIKQDITERNKTEQMLARERDLLQALMDNQPDFIYGKDASSRYTSSTARSPGVAPVASFNGFYSKISLGFGFHRLAACATLSR